MLRRSFLATSLVVALTLSIGAVFVGCDDGHEHEHEPDAHFGWAGALDATAAVNADHSLTVTLTSAADGTPMEGATLIAEEPWMEMHGHGSGATPATTVEVGAGVYTISGVKFIMPGEWTVKVHGTKGEMHEHHVFTFTVE